MIQIDVDAEPPVPLQAAGGGCHPGFEYGPPTVGRLPGVGRRSA